MSVVPIQANGAKASGTRFLYQDHVLRNLAISCSSMSTWKGLIGYYYKLIDWKSLELFLTLVQDRRVMENANTCSIIWWNFFLMTKKNGNLKPQTWSSSKTSMNAVLFVCWILKKHYWPRFNNRYLKYYSREKKMALQILNEQL